MEERILKWIDEYQSGKSGIYPYQVALQVCAEFVIPIEEAQDYVAEHIKQVLKGVIRPYQPTNNQPPNPRRRACG